MIILILKKMAKIIIILMNKRSSKTIIILIQKINKIKIKIKVII